MDPEGVREITCEGFFIANIPGGVGDKEDEQIASMITAAPYLLAALKKCLAQLEIVLPESGRVHDETQAIIDGYAAISKAKGRQ